MLVEVHQREGGAQVIVFFFKPRNLTFTVSVQPSPLALPRG